MSILTYLDKHYPISAKGARESRTLAPERFDRLEQMFMSWAKGVLGEDAEATVSQGFVQFTTSVNMAQARYEVAGRYAPDSFHDDLYQEAARMEPYLWGVFATLWMWVHHLELAQFFEDRFLQRLKPDAKIVELAPGHGGWGCWALHRLPGATLQGYDISPSSTEIATRLAKASGADGRARYQTADALAAPAEPGAYDSAISGFVIEHLETPERLFQSLAAYLRPGGFAFLTGALTAAQEDHVFEFRRESELVTMAEQNGFRVLETMSASPSRLRAGTRCMPRSMGLIMQRRTGELW